MPWQRFSQPNTNRLNAKIGNRSNECQALRNAETIECDKCIMKRIEVNDQDALTIQGHERYKKGDYSEAFEYWTKAAELEDVEAHFRLSDLYRFGEVVEKDMEKVINHLEAAAIGGHPNARYDPGCMEWNWNNNKAERAVKHWVIGARHQGHDDSIKGLMYAYKRGFVSKVNLQPLSVNTRQL